MAAVLTAVGVAAVLVGPPPVRLAGLVLVALAVVAWRWTAAMRRGIELVWDGPVRLQPDSVGVGTTIVRNRSRWPAPWVTVQVRLPDAAADPHRHRIVIALRGRRERRHDVSFAAGRRGVHEPAELSWRASDPLGLADVAGGGTSLRPMVITPRLRSVAALITPPRSPLADQPDRTSLFVDQTAVVGVRPYEAGDPLSSIHWPATAGAGALLRKDFARASAHEVLVCLDLSRDGYQRKGRPRVAEAAISVAASLLADAIVARRQQAGLAIARDRPGAMLDRERAEEPVAPVATWAIHGGDTHLHAMIDALARAELHDASAFGEVVRQATARAHAGVSVVAVTGEPDPALAGALALVRRRGLSVTVLSVGSGAGWRSRVPTHLGGVPCVAVPADRGLDGTMS